MLEEWESVTTRSARARSPSILFASVIFRFWNNALLIRSTHFLRGREWPIARNVEIAYQREGKASTSATTEPVPSYLLNARRFPEGQESLLLRCQ